MTKLKPNGTNHQGNANQNHKDIGDIISHLLEWLLSERQKITSVDHDVEKKEHFSHCWWE